MSDGKKRNNNINKRVADEFDAFVRVILAGSRGWTIAAPDDVFAFFLCYYYETQGKGTKLVHATSCPGVGREGDKACLAGSSLQDARAIYSCLGLDGSGGNNENS